MSQKVGYSDGHIKVWLLTTMLKHSGENSIIGENTPYKNPQDPRRHEYYLSHRGEILEKSRTYRQTHKKVVKERQSKYYAEHADQQREKHQAYYHSHKAEAAIAARKYREAHKVEKRQSTRRYRRDLRTKFLDIYGHKCSCVCGCTETIDGFLTIGHIQNDGKEDRASTGGGNWSMIVRAVKYPDKTRYQTLCWNCNSGADKNGGVCPRITASKVGHQHIGSEQSRSGPSSISVPACP